MNYKEIFRIALLLISSPAKAWEEIRLEEDKRKVHTAFVYPMIALCSLSVFLGALFDKGWGSPAAFQYAMTECCVMAVSLFGGYFLASYVINEIAVKYLQLPNDINSIYQLVGYSQVVIFLTNIVTGIFPSFTFIGLLSLFYTVYVVWEGTTILLNIKEEIKLKFTLIVSFFIIICPILIQTVFNKLLFILH